MAGHELIDAHQRALARRLPAEVVEEVADGLTETWQRCRTEGFTPIGAAHAAIAEFGTADEIIAAFVLQSPGRRLARLLLATGPLVGAAWGVSLVTAQAWTWAVSTLVAAAFGLTLLAVVGTLVSAATSRRSYRRARLGIAAGLSLVALDAGMLATLVFLAPTPAWPMLIAVPASLGRIAVTLHAYPEASIR